MKVSVHKREKAEELRRRGYSYGDIIKEVGLAKSTLSNWLKNFPLTPQEKNYLKDRVNHNISHGRIKSAAAHRKRRIGKEKLLFEEAKEEFELWSSIPHFLIGVALYWAEGTKRGYGFSFTNSDPQMVRVMVEWIRKYLADCQHSLHARLYTHKPFANDGQEEFWSKITSLGKDKFRKTIYKPHINLVRKRPNYKGCLRLMIGIGSANALYKVKIWQKLLIKHSLGNL